MKKLRQYLLPVFLLVLIDQSVKLVIQRWFLAVRVDLIPPILTFRPYLNTKLSYAGHFLSAFSNFWVLILINIILFLAMITGFLFYQEKRVSTSRTVSILMVFGFAGNGCSIIDRIFWGGSLDFIMIPNLFTFDLKDCYLTVFEILCILLMLLHNEEIRMKEFLCFCWQKLKR